MFEEMREGTAADLKVQLEKEKKNRGEFVVIVLPE